MNSRLTTFLAVLPLAGHLSDRFGRKRIIGIGCIGTGLWVFMLFALMNTRSVALVIFGLFVDGILQDLQYGPQAAIIAENFPASRRYTGSGLGYHLAAITAGGPAPAVSAYLFLTFQSSTAIATYAFVTTVVSLATLPLLKDRAGTLDRVRALTTHPAFSFANPNRVRALIGAFAHANHTQFNRPDGAGHHFVTDTVLSLDARNPQVASRLLSAFKSWRALEPVRRQHAEAALRKVVQTEGLSEDVQDIARRALGES